MLIEVQERLEDVKKQEVRIKDVLDKQITNASMSYSDGVIQTSIETSGFL